MAKKKPIPKGMSLDEKHLASLAGQGLPDKAIAVLMDCEVGLFATWPHLRKIIDRARATLQLELASNYITSAKGTPAKPETAPGRNDGVAAVEPNLRAAENVLTRLGYHDAPLESELTVRVVWDDDAPPESEEDDPKPSTRKPVDIKTVVATAVAVSVAARGLIDKNAKRS